MDAERVARVTVPPWYRGVRRNEKGWPARGYRSLAFDIETVRGWPYTLQISDGEQTTLEYLEPAHFLPRLIRAAQGALDRRPRQTVVVWGFNLSYDLPALLYPWADRFNNDRFTLTYRGHVLEVFCGKIPFAKLYIRGGREPVWIVDAFAFVWCSLARAAKVWGLPIQKLPRPVGLGRRVLRSRAFEEYAKQDALATWHLGRVILEQHREFNVRLCVSVAQFAARVFTHHFLQQPFPRPPDAVIRAALLAYHGGKNGFYVRPGWVRRCREYDVRSAYPWAMSQMPSLDRGAWRYTATFDPAREGFYQVWGEVRPDRYPILYSHDFHPLVGTVRGEWITSYELREALRTQEIDLGAVRGWVWVPRSRKQPLAAFVRDFYHRKTTSAPGPQREVYKLMLNSLYGKFIQLNPDGKGGETPGGYWHPPLAAWITACVRARMHALEHQAESLHTATDSVITRRRLPTGTGLGDLEDVITGPALLVRNKVYFHFSDDGREMKYALHGIRLQPRAFWKMLLAGRRTYTVTHLLRPREAQIMKTRPLQPILRTYTVNIGALRMRPLPRQAVLFWSRSQRR